MFLTSILLALSLAPGEVVVALREPALPEHAQLQFNATCGQHSLQLTGFGDRRPSTAMPRLKIDERPIELPPSAISFLSKKPSSYRLSVQCDKSSPKFYFRMYRVSKENGGEPEYAVYGLDLLPNEIVRDTGEVQANSDTFW